MITSLSIAKSIDLSPPISIEKVVMYRDGGTIGIELKDINNKTISFCIDSRFGSKTRGKIYIGSTHPTHKNTKIVNDIEFEKQLIHTIIEIVNNNHTQQEIDRVQEKPIDFTKLTEEELKLYRIFRLIKLYKNLTNQSRGPDLPPKGGIKPGG